MRISDWSSDVCSSDLDGGCKGTHFGQGFVDGDGTRGDYGSSDFLDINGNNPYPDTVNLLVGHLPGSARAYPSFVIPYRGGVAGENPGTDYSQPLNRKNRSEEHTSELQSLMRISYAVFCLKNKKHTTRYNNSITK